MPVHPCHILAHHKHVTLLVVECHGADSVEFGAIEHARILARLVSCKMRVPAHHKHAGCLLPLREVATLPKLHADHIRLVAVHKIVVISNVHAVLLACAHQLAQPASVFARRRPDGGIGMDSNKLLVVLFHHQVISSGEGVHGTDFVSNGTIDCSQCCRTSIRRVDLQDKRLPAATRCQDAHKSVGSLVELDVLQHVCAGAQQPTPQPPQSP
mmetsp:Transcript_36304/g.74502  ORF Transcript_36304/g.74502 Transcript_36304/m.74502 type:complete len:212 (-) Transcript_36304:3574-4209(-)